jgi:putative membrane protein
VSGYAGETTLWEGHPSWKAMLLFYIKWTLVSLIPVVIWVLLNAVGVDISSTWFDLATLVLLVLTYAGGWLLRRTTSYLVTDRRIRIRRGIASRHEATTHIDRVQNVNLSQTLFQRLLGIGDVDWDTAGTDAPESDFTFRGIDDPGALVRVADRFHVEAMRAETQVMQPPPAPPADGL